MNERLLLGENGDDSVSDEEGGEAKLLSMKPKEYEGIRMDEREEVEEIKENKFKCM